MRLAKVIFADMKKIDLEFHYLIPEMLEAMAHRTEVPTFDPVTKIMKSRDNLPGLPYGMGQNGETSMYFDLCDMGEARIAAMDKAGIDVGVLAPSVGFEELSHEESVRLCKLANDKVAEAVRKYPDRFMGAAVLPAPYVDEAIIELERCVNELGFKYWHTSSNYNKEFLYESKFEPLLKRSEELGAAFYLHPNTPSSPNLIDNGAMFAAAGLGFGQDTMKTAVRLILNGTFDKYPKLRMMIGHLGEYFPFVLDRMDNRFYCVPDPFVKCKYPISYYFKNKNILVTTSGNMSRAAFECTKSVLGIDSIIFGSDYPYENYKEMSDFVDSLPLTDDEKEKVWSGNALKYILK